MSTPNETHLRAARSVGLILTGNRPADIDIASILARHFPAAPASPATPSGTPSDAELVRFLQDFAGWELAGGDALRDSGNAAADKVCRENADRINEAAARITALSAQVVELECWNAKGNDLALALEVANDHIAELELERENADLRASNAELCAALANLVADPTGNRSWIKAVYALSNARKLAP